VVPDILPGWRVRYLHDGVGLVPSDGTGAGAVRIREQVPLRRARDAIASVREVMRVEGEVAIGPLERLVTTEGEHAALATLTAAGERWRQHTIGLVWGDHLGSQIDGTTADPTWGARIEHAVRELTRLHSLGRGELRRRRYEYAPPPDWRAYPRGLIAEWYPPGFPDEHGLITVFPTRAGRDTPASQLDRILHEASWFGFERQAMLESSEVTTTDGMPGQRWVVVGRFPAGRPLRHEIVVFHDRRFLYPLRLETGAQGPPGHLDVFAALVRSVQRVPVPADDQAATALSHWVS
jgi:hypothetical protein